MNQYRKLDDSITMRYNRTTAQFRDLDRLGVGKGTVQDQACAHLWRDLVGTFLYHAMVSNALDSHVRRELEAENGNN